LRGRLGRGNAASRHSRVQLREFRPGSPHGTNTPLAGEAGWGEAASRHPGRASNCPRLRGTSPRRARSSPYGWSRAGRGGLPVDEIRGPPPGKSFAASAALQGRNPQAASQPSVDALPPGRTMAGKQIDWIRQWNNAHCTRPRPASPSASFS
jgi:hypothetical protein